MIKGVPYRAHRAAYVAKHGSIPPKLFICHKCHTKNCINPDHLYAGNAAENARDRSENKWEKERKDVGSKISNILRTTVDLPRELYVQAKMMSLLTGKPMSHLIRISLSEKIKQLKENANPVRDLSGDGGTTGK